MSEEKKVKETKEVVTQAPSNVQQPQQNNYVSFVKQNDQVEITNFVISAIKDFFNEEQGNKITKYNTNGILSYLFDYTQKSLNELGIVNIGLKDPEKEQFTKEEILDVKIKPSTKQQQNKQ